MATGPLALSEPGSDPASVPRLIAQFDVLEEQEVNADAGRARYGTPDGHLGVRANHEAFVASGANHLVFEIDRLAVDDDRVMTQGWMKMIYPRAAAQAIGVEVLTIGEDAHQTGPVSVTTWNQEDLPQAYIDQKRAAAEAHA